MIRVSDAANTSNTNDAATQRNACFVKFRKFVKLRLNLATLTAAALITIGLAPALSRYWLVGGDLRP
jgi:hypothetical protein